MAQNPHWTTQNTKTKSLGITFLQSDSDQIYMEGKHIVDTLAVILSNFLPIFYFDRQQGGAF